MKNDLINSQTPVPKDWWNPDPEDPFWVLEDSEGSWLKNKHSAHTTTDIFKAIRYPSESHADAERKCLRGSAWIAFKPVQKLWSEFDVISRPKSDLLLKKARELVVTVLQSWGHSNATLSDIRAGKYDHAACVQDILTAVKVPEDWLVVPEGPFDEMIVAAMETEGMKAVNALVSIQSNRGYPIPVSALPHGQSPLVQAWYAMVHKAQEFLGESDG